MKHTDGQLNTYMTSRVPSLVRFWKNIGLYSLVILTYSQDITSTIKASNHHSVSIPSWRILSFLKELRGLRTKQVLIKIVQVIVGRYVRFKGRIFDRRYGTETSEMVEHPSNLVGNKIAVGEPYVPMPSGVVHQTINGLEECIFAHGAAQRRPEFADFCLYDFGSGKGRVLIIALEYIFKQVIGVEYSSSLNNIARKNMDICQAARPKMSPVHLFLCDAANFTNFEYGLKFTGRRPCPRRRTAAARSA